MENPNRFLSAIQVAITLSGFLGAAFGTENFSGYLTAFLVGLGLPVSAGVLGVVSMVVVTLVISFFSIAFGEMVPKRIAMQRPEPWARAALGVMGGISRIFAPMMALLGLTTNGTLKLFGLKTEAEDTAASEEEIRLMVENSGEQGTIAQEEQQWIENVFDFGDLTASDVMTPEPDVVALALDADPADILHTIREIGCSRYPRLPGQPQRDLRHPQCPGVPAQRPAPGSPAAGKPAAPGLQCAGKRPRRPAVPGYAGPQTAYGRSGG